MPLPLTTYEDLRDHLITLGVRSGDNLVVHSRLLAFGRIEGGVSTVFAAIADVIGPTGTIVVPTYALDNKEPYDPRHTPSQGVGALGEYVRTLPGAIRSACPLHNHAGVGPKAAVLAEVTGLVSLGRDSDFDALHRHGFRLLLLGAAFSDGATFLHHMEAVVGVPYRKWLVLDRRRVNAEGQVVAVQCRYYARDDLQWHEDFDRVVPLLLDAGLIARVACAFGFSTLGALSDIHRLAEELLKNNPYALVRPVDQPAFKNHA